MEAGRKSLEIAIRKRVDNYLLNTLKMDKTRWPYICLKEELRGVRNNNPTKWGKQLVKVFHEVGDGEEIDWITENRKIEVETNLGNCLKI